jgi:hypothetical protein
MGLPSGVAVVCAGDRVLTVPAVEADQAAGRAQLDITTGVWEPLDAPPRRFGVFGLGAALGDALLLVSNEGTFALNPVRNEWRVLEAGTRSPEDLVAVGDSMAVVQDRAHGTVRLSVVSL